MRPTGSSGMAPAAMAAPVASVSPSSAFAPRAGVCAGTRIVGLPPRGSGTNDSLSHWLQPAPPTSVFLRSFNLA